MHENVYERVKRLFGEVKPFVDGYGNVDLIAVDRACETHKRCLVLYLSNNNTPHLKDGVYGELMDEMLRQYLFDRLQFERLAVAAYGAAAFSSVDSLRVIYREVNAGFWAVYGERMSPVYGEWEKVVVKYG